QAAASLGFGGVRGDDRRHQCGAGAGGADRVGILCAAAATGAAADLGALYVRAALCAALARPAGSEVMAGRKAGAGEWGAPSEIKYLSGGNPQIPMGYGELPVRTYIEAM